MRLSARVYDGSTESFVFISQMLGRLMALVVGSSPFENFLSWHRSRAAHDASSETDEEYRHFQYVLEVLPLLTPPLPHSFTSSPTPSRALLNMSTLVLVASLSAALISGAKDSNPQHNHPGSHSTPHTRTLCTPDGDDSASDMEHLLLEAGSDAENIPREMSLLGILRVLPCERLIR